MRAFIARYSPAGFSPCLAPLRWRILSTRCRRALSAERQRFTAIIDFLSITPLLFFRTYVRDPLPRDINSDAPGAAMPMIHAFHTQRSADDRAFERRSGNGSAMFEPRRRPSCLSRFCRHFARVTESFSRSLTRRVVTSPEMRTTR